MGPLEPNRFLACFINATTMLGPFNNLREESLASKGRILVEIVELLSGKPGAMRSVHGVSCHVHLPSASQSVLLADVHLQHLARSALSPSMHLTNETAPPQCPARPCPSLRAAARR